MNTKHDIYYKNLAIFRTKKIGADSNNETYTLGDGTEVFEGTPDVSYFSHVFIKDERCIYTHGTMFYASNTDGRIKALETAVENLRTALGTKVNSATFTAYKNEVADTFDLTNKTIEDNELVTASALNEIKDAIEANELVVASALNKINKTIEEDELVTASALNNIKQA